MSRYIMLPNASWGEAQNQVHRNRAGFVICEDKNRATAVATVVARFGEPMADVEKRAQFITMALNNQSTIINHQSKG